MPDVDGLELLRYVRSNQQLADLPVISEWYLQQLVHMKRRTVSDGLLVEGSSCFW